MKLKAYSILETLVAFVIITSSFSIGMNLIGNSNLRNNELLVSKGNDELTFFLSDYLNSDFFGIEKTYKSDDFTFKFHTEESGNFIDIRTIKVEIFNVQGEELNQVTFMIKV